MGAFNILVAVIRCSNCGNLNTFDLQFKYGNTWQLRYVIGQKIEWGGNNIGIPKCQRVRVEAIGGPCGYCKADNLEFDINIENDFIINVLPVNANDVRDGGYTIESS